MRFRSKFAGDSLTDFFRRMRGSSLPRVIRLILSWGYIPRWRLFVASIFIRWTSRIRLPRGSGCSRSGLTDRASKPTRSGRWSTLRGGSDRLKTWIHWSRLLVVSRSMLRKFTLPLGMIVARVIPRRCFRRLIGPRKKREEASSWAFTVVITVIS